MKKLILWLCNFVLFFCIVSSVAASDKATKDECVLKSREAAQMVRTKGIEATISAINDKKGPFVWKDSYVFCINIVTQQIAAHPFQPDLIGMQIEHISDKKGKVFYSKMIHSVKDTVDEKGEGWIKYRWKTPDGKLAATKVTYIYKVPGYQYLMGAGVFE